MKKRTIVEAAHTIIEKHVFVKYACDPPKTPNTKETSINIAFNPMEHTKLTPIESLSHYFTKNRKKISLPNLFFSNTIVFEQLQDPPETPNTEETSVSVAYNSMENTNSEQSSLSPNKSSISPTKTHDEVIDDLEIEHDQNLDMLLPIDEAPEIQLNGELFNEENCDIKTQRNNSCKDYFNNENKSFLNELKF